MRAPLMDKVVKAQILARDLVKVWLVARKNPLIDSLLLSIKKIQSMISSRKTTINNGRAKCKKYVNK
jgi:hypothetical protein